MATTTTAVKETAFHVNNLVIGGGVVGLAVGARLARSEWFKKTHVQSFVHLHYRHHQSGQSPAKLSTLVVEKNALPGEEISSRNSEVIHAGLYYPAESLKTRLCVEGNTSLHRLADKYHIPHRQCGKWIVAQDDGHGDDETQYLHRIFEEATNKGVSGLRFVSKAEVERTEPAVSCSVALESSTSGIIDSYQLMQFFLYVLRCDGMGDLVCRTRVKHMEPLRDGDPESPFLVYIEDPPCWIVADRVVNCAGLHSDRVARMLHLHDCGTPIPRLHFWKGSYMGYRGSMSSPIVSRLIYPTPEKNIVGLGTHLTIDLMNHVRFGPDAEYIDDTTVQIHNDPIKTETMQSWAGHQLPQEDCNVTFNFDFSVPESDTELRDQFYNSIRRYLPHIEKDRLYPEYAGVRPKLQGPGDPFQDFHIAQAGPYRNFINTIGIESPGLTCSPAIANMVARMLYGDDPLLGMMHQEHTRLCDFPA